MQGNFSRYLAIGTFALAAGPFTPAQAQDAVPQAADGTGIEDIVVTAQRRAESLQSVPIAVSAVTAAALERSGLGSTLDLPVAAPGLVMNTSRSTVIPYLRGVGTANAGASEESSVATYVDGIYIPALPGTTMAFNNIERIEVLKGPQGTLFGRNATGGLIHVITRDPSHTPLLQGSASYGNYDTITGNVYATTGLSDSVAVDVAGYISNQGKGWGRNRTLNQEINYTKEWAVRSKLLFTPTDELKITLAGDYTHRNSDIGVERQALPGARLSGGFTYTGGFYDTLAGVGRDARYVGFGGSLKVEYDLGGPTITSTTAYRKAKNELAFDQDGTPLPRTDTTTAEITRSFQQEFLLVGDTGPLDYTVGLYYFWASGGTQPLALTTLFPAVAPVLASNVARFSDQTVKSYAAFAQGTYKLGDSTRLTAGLRYTTDRRGISGRDVARPGNPQPVGTVTASNSQRKTFSKLSWRAAIDQDLAEGVLAYASYSRGFKSGVFNITNFNQPAAAPETLDAYEVGIKSDLLDRTLRLNLSGFYYDYKNIQLLQVNAGVTSIYNATTAKIHGGELEATIAPPVAAGSLLININAAYLHGRYGPFVRLPNGTQGLPNTTPNPAGGNIIANISVPGGKSTVRTPPVTVNIGGDYSYPVGDGALGLNVTYYFNAGYFFEPDNRVKQESYNLLNAQLSYSGANERWRVALYARNITKERYFNQVSIGSLGDQFTGNPPRTYGVSLGFKFGG